MVKKAKANDVFCTIKIKRNPDFTLNKTGKSFLKQTGKLKINH